MTPTGLGLAPRHLNRKTPWRLVKNTASGGIDPRRLGSRGIGHPQLTQDGDQRRHQERRSMHEVREVTGHADIRTTEVLFHPQGGRRWVRQGDRDSTDGTKDLVSHRQHELLRTSACN